MADWWYRFITYPGWDFWGVATAIILALTSTIWAYVRRERRQLQYYVIEFPLVTKSSYLEGEAEIIYQGVKLTDNVTGVIIFFENVGNKDLKREWFDRSIAITTDQSCEIIKPAELYKSSNDLQPVIANESSHRVVIEPLLLNKRDFFSIILWLHGPSPILSVNTRIEGISEGIKKSSGPEFYSEGIYLRIKISITLLIIGLICKVIFPEPLMNYSNHIMFIPLVGFLATSLFIAVTIIFVELLGDIKARKSKLPSIVKKVLDL